MVIMALPIVGACVLGRGGSLALLYVYVLLFDSCRYLGHCNAEMFSPAFLAKFPILRYLIYTPS
jgi:hypothetical protein